MTASNARLANTALQKVLIPAHIPYHAQANRDYPATWPRSPDPGHETLQVTFIRHAEAFCLCVDRTPIESGTIRAEPEERWMVGDRFPDYVMHSRRH